MTESRLPWETTPETAGAAPDHPAAAPDDPTAAPAEDAPRVPPVVSTRRLLGASFELLTGSTDQMRRASFYVGMLTLGTIGPLVLAIWGSAALGREIPLDRLDEVMVGSLAGWFATLIVLAMAGAVVAIIESQAMAIALLGGRYVERPLSIREAIQRARMSFWRLIVAGIVISVPISTLQGAADAGFGTGSPMSLGVGLILGLAIQAPFVYAACGVVLGGVGPLEALGRSVRVFRARKAAGVLLAILPTVFQILLLFGLFAGLDILFRIVDALGLGTDSGPVGMALVTVLILAGVFAVGTLLFTLAAIIVAPQVVMFVGLTHTTIGLDHVRPGGSHAVEMPHSVRHRFRWLTRPMLAAFILGAAGVASIVSTVT